MELLIDGVRYELWTPKIEAELEAIVEEHAEAIFGEDSKYFNIKKKIKSKAGTSSIPDGYVIIVGDEPGWYIVEVELTYHDPYDHILSQMTRFINGIRNVSSQIEIVNAIYRRVNEDEILKTWIKQRLGAIEIHSFLSDLISRDPTLAIIIEEETEKLLEVSKTLSKNIETKVVEFKTFERDGVGSIVHAHSFEPIRKSRVVRKTAPFEVTKETWSKEEILEFWNLLTDGAKEALRVIAKQPDGCPREDTLKELGIDGYQLAGRLSSVGHALHNFPSKLRPVKFNWSSYEHYMIPELSRAIIELSL